MLKRMALLIKLRYDRMNSPTRMEKQGPPSEWRPISKLVLLFTSLLAAALARQRFFNAFLLARLEVEGVTLHFLDDVLLLDFAFKTTQGIL